MSTIKKIAISLLVLGSLSTSLAYAAQTTLPTGSGTVSGSGSGNNAPINIGISNPFRCGNNGDDCTLIDLIKAILNNIIMPIAAVLIVLWIIYAGFQFVIAQGNPTALATARRNLLWSLIGAGVLLGAAGISEVIQRTVETLVK